MSLKSHWSWALRTGICQSLAMGKVADFKIRSISFSLCPPSQYPWNFSFVQRPRVSRFGSRKSRPLGRDSLTAEDYIAYLRCVRTSGSQYLGSWSLKWNLTTGVKKTTENILLFCFSSKIKNFLIWKIISKNIIISITL